MTVSTKIKTTIRNLLDLSGYELRKIEKAGVSRPLEESDSAPPPIDPIWPLPTRSKKLEDSEIERKFAQFEFWHYSYEFEGGLSFRSKHQAYNEERYQLDQFRHVMPYIMLAADGSLKNKRILDIGCNSGFWSIQLALLGADVTAIDTQPAMIEQANLIKEIVDPGNVEFLVMNLNDLRSETWREKFDLVIASNILVHLPDPYQFLRLIGKLSKDRILLNTRVSRAAGARLDLRMQEQQDIAGTPGLSVLPSRTAIEYMLRDLGFTGWLDVPIRPDHLSDNPGAINHFRKNRVTWLLKAPNTTS